jgi:hypothetical protein
MPDKNEEIEDKIRRFQNALPEERLRMAREASNETALRRCLKSPCQFPTSQNGDRRRRRDNPQRIRCSAWASRAPKSPTPPDSMTAILISLPVGQEIQRTKLRR